MKKIPVEPMKAIAKPMKKIPVEPMKTNAKPMKRIASKTKKHVRHVPAFVTTTDEHGNEAFKRNPILDELAE